MNRSRLIVVLVASGAILALGLAGLAWTLGAGSSEAEQGATHNCPSPGKWSIAVWEGDDDADVDQALATCGEDAVEAAYYLDPETQVWSRWFAGNPQVSNLSTVNDMQGVLALGSAQAPATPISGLPNPASVYCTEQGYELTIVENAAGQVGMCGFPDGTECEEWSFYRGECGQEWATATVSAQQAGTMRNCPNPGKWSIAVWDGDDAASADHALATCGEDAVAAAYSIDSDTQAWSRWFTGEPDLSTLSTLDNLQGVIALGAGTAPQTPTLAAGWTKIEPGGDTICATGTPYAFFVHPGTVNRLVLFFEGAGLCWDASTCSSPGVGYDATVDETDNPANHPQGMFDLDNPENPFKDWYQVYVPSCTGDGHWGDATATYHWGGKDYTMNYKGFANVSAVLDWIQAGFQEPEKFFVAGCCGGAPVSVIGAAHLHALYPDVPFYQLGDSGASVPDSGAALRLQTWGWLKNPVDWIPALQVPATEMTMAGTYIAVANYYPQDRWAQYNTAHDQAQTLVYPMLGGTGDWSQLMLANMQEIQDGAPNFHSYIAPGAIHCITPLDSFYTREVNGVKFVDWLDAMVNDQPWDNVMCTDCETDPLAGSPSYWWR